MMRSENLNFKKLKTLKVLSSRNTNYDHMVNMYLASRVAFWVAAPLVAGWAVMKWSIKIGDSNTNQHFQVSWSAYNHLISNANS